MAKNPPCNTGDTSSTPGQGTKIPHATTKTWWTQKINNFFLNKFFKKNQNTQRREHALLGFFPTGQLLNSHYAASDWAQKKSDPLYKQKLVPEKHHHFLSFSPFWLPWVTVAAFPSAGLATLRHMGSRASRMTQELACNMGDRALTPGLGRSPGEGNGYPLQYSCLENSVDRGAWWATSMRLQRVRHDWASTTFTSYGILVPQPGIKPVSPTLESRASITGLAREIVSLPSLIETVHKLQRNRKTYFIKNTIYYENIL